MPPYQRSYRRGTAYKVPVMSRSLRPTGRPARAERMFVAAGIPRPMTSSSTTTTYGIFSFYQNVVTASVAGVYRYSISINARNVMEALITQNNRLQAMLDAHEFVALVWYRIRYMPKQFLLPADNSSSTFQTIALDRQGVPGIAGVGDAARVLTYGTSHVTSVGDRRISKTNFLIKADSDRTNTSYFQPASTLSGNFYIPASGQFSTLTLGVQTDGPYPAGGTPSAGFYYVTGKIAFRALRF